MMETKKFCDKLIQLRREKGYSQEQLADYLNVSRQAVSKWEADQTMPALDKIIQLADLFGVSVDFMVRDNAESEDRNKTVVTTVDNTAVMNQIDELKDLVRHSDVYEYKSKRTFLGLPLVHICLSRSGRITHAKGVIAIGSTAVGIITLGAISVGVISFGALSLGLLLGLGAIAGGFIGIGACAFGVVAFGAAAVGIYAIGASATALNIGVGASASGKIAIGQLARGKYTFDVDTATKDQVLQVIHDVYPKIPEWIARLFTIGLKY